MGVISLVHVIANWQAQYEEDRGREKAQFQAILRAEEEAHLR